MKLFVNRIFKNDETKLKSTFIINTPCFVNAKNLSKLFFFFFEMEDRNIYY